jgi:hypothetical protein
MQRIVMNRLEIRLGCEAGSGIASDCKKCARVFGKPKSPDELYSEIVRRCIF